ncbi:diguanylate cyclase (GGDEF)-like protein [Kibdelosporangium banguiense]|uniref:Diguanylate cyclase (GGDEF)-like protein n=1 Tax=Kibdelosporangium banguiense TaxID=1365924 RepID=A0ABS4TD82_9PSEU|nr:diguanylate cyclase [Kibdelosporangium banguiense]MBP2322382.1 diguanylate cyclase (GGDEF)-like protein [Kibdelosporangium banguiense]
MSVRGDQLAWMTVRRWALWQLPRRSLIGYVLTIDALALGGVASSLSLISIDQDNAVPFILLTSCAVLYTELSRPIERMRERYKGTPFIDLNSVWMFAAILLLHPALSAVVIIVSYFSRWVRVRPNPLYRRTFSTAAAIAAGYAAYAYLVLMSGIPFSRMPRNVDSFGLVVSTGLVFLIVNTILITIAVYLGTPHKKIRQALGSPADYALEAATIALGIMMAWALVDWPIALLLIIGITLVLHRSVLIRQLRDQARADAKTGLLNSASWSKDAAEELTRSPESCTALLMLDLDNFKSINDRHGHLIGDKHLRGVADVLKSEVRATDLVGRFGGEEFVILLPNTTQHDALAIAERIRRRIATVATDGVDTVTVSVGVASHPEHGTTLDEVVSAADSALLAAKTAGRNRTLLFALPPP